MQNQTPRNQQKSELSPVKYDQNLHRTFVRLGHNRRLLANELLSILPEIFERKIWCKYARTIEAYAAKFGGLSGSVVRKRLRLEKYVEDKPHLRDAIRTEGVHKVALVASLATVENEEIWADKVKNMSKPAIQELSKEVRWKMERGEISSGEAVNLNLFTDEGWQHNENCKTVQCSAAPQQIRITLEGELFFLFLKLKKKYGEGLTNQEVAMKIFEENLSGAISKVADSGEKSKEAKCEEKEAQASIKSDEKVKVLPLENSKIPQSQSSKTLPGERTLQSKFQNADHEKEAHRVGICLGNERILSENVRPKQFAPRYVPVQIRRNVLQKSSGKCSYPGCQRPPKIFHHTDRFANSKSHESLKTVCKVHHEFAHNGLIADERSAARDWHLQLQTGELDKIDRLYRQYRKNYKCESHK